jgi:hypothetical protein
MRATAAALLVALPISLQFAWAAEPDPSEKAITPGWYRVTMAGKSFERCYLEAGTLPAAADDLGECKIVKQVENGETFELVQSCQIDEDAIKIRVSGIARPGYLKATTEFVEVPEEMREFFKGALTMEAQRVRACTADELSKVKGELSKLKK